MWLAIKLSDHSKAVVNPSLIGILKYNMTLAVIYGAKINAEKTKTISNIFFNDNHLFIIIATGCWAYFLIVCSTCSKRVLKPGKIIGNILKTTIIQITLTIKDAMLLLCAAVM
ncbi:hypothetical protein [Desulfofalx alkaliphila]|uniref:hypothetical protein n=1 Tax=Desulfofalx alkaliphila TaxID=105483 RepID=UPI001A9A5928|nr:hypothetical protein [Desulfofalx alkaliphila]